MAKILVLYNAPTLPESHPDAIAERDVLETVDVIAGYLSHAGHAVERLGLADTPQPLLDYLKTKEPAVVFNLFEGTAVLGQTEAYVAGLLEWSGIPFTGCPMPAMVVARDKVLTKRLLRGGGLPTADFFVVESSTDPVPQPDRWPVFVKPTNEDASVGVDQGCVVQSPMELQRRIAWLCERYRPPFLVEDYLAGQEFNVGVIDDPEPIALPVAEIVFDPTQMHSSTSATDATKPSAPWWPIVSYASKWTPGSAEDLAALPRCPAQIAEPLAARLQALALSAYRLIGCRGYGRIDFRTDSSGTPYILEVNPNPDFGPTAGLARALTASGKGHREFTLRMIDRLLTRELQR